MNIVEEKMRGEGKRERERMKGLDEEWGRFEQQSFKVCPTVRKKTLNPFIIAENELNKTCNHIATIIIMIVSLHAPRTEDTYAADAAAAKKSLKLENHFPQHVITVN